MSLRNYCLIYLVSGHQHLQHHPQHHHQYPQHLQQPHQHPPQQQPLLTKFETSLEGGYGFSVAKSNSFSSAPSSGLGISGTNSSSLSSSRRKECECPMCYHSASNPCGVCGCPSRDIKTRNESQGEICSHWFSSYITALSLVQMIHSVVHTSALLP